MCGVSEDEHIPDILSKNGQPKNKWDDEDLDDVKDSWEDEEELALVWSSSSIFLLVFNALWD